MKAEETQALIEWAHKWTETQRRIAENNPLDESAKALLALHEIALAALIAQPDDWQQRAEAAEVKLAGLEKQEPVAWHIYQLRDSPKGWGWYLTKSFSSQPKIGDGWKSDPLFARPAPAASLAELVPDELTREVWKQLFMDENYQDTFRSGFSACRAAILRNIEEAK